ncbi:uncharacterized protein YALI1_E12421g [Yarrowia lipolytica]|uniref:Secreted protein n=1 Tax=Yarrowia lipolytica TaxID=4952 RepID=A0A1D8NHV0_YARLL|nr:hypothetical protein YALI1_E12421g [Yarrowia lipolytica]
MKVHLSLLCLSSWILAGLDIMIPSFLRGYRIPHVEHEPREKRCSFYGTDTPWSTKLSDSYRGIKLRAESEMQRLPHHQTQPTDMTLLPHARLARWLKKATTFRYHITIVFFCR